MVPVQSKITGKWRQVLPACDTLPDICRYVCSIGDRQVLMIGAFSETPNKEETWLYTHSIPEWRRINCDTTPNVEGLPNGRWLCKISKKRAIFWGEWCFDLDSLQWYPIKYSTYEPQLYIGEDSTVSYSRSEKRTYLVKMNPEESFDSPNFLEPIVLNDENETGFGPSTGMGFIDLNIDAGDCFRYFNKDRFVNYFKHSPNAASMNRDDDYKWFWLDTGEIYRNDSIITYRGWNFRELANNILSGYTGWHDPKTNITYEQTLCIIEYDTVFNRVTSYILDTNVTGFTPTELNTGTNSAQCSEGMLVKALNISDLDSISLVTWVFEVDNVSIPSGNDEDTLKLLT
jgi:hypothetical protein